MIVLIAGEKGGTGKTTIATNLAALRAQRQSTPDLLLIDTDRQATASYWCSLRDDNEVIPRIDSVQKFGNSVRSEVLALKEKYTDIIIDAGGRDSAEMRSGLLVADIIIIPLRPSQFDLWTLSRMNEIVMTAKVYNLSLIAYVVMNQGMPHPAVRELDDAAELIQEFPDLTLLKTFISSRISFRKASIGGLSVVEHFPSDHKAIIEITNLYEAIFND